MTNDLSRRTFLLSAIGAAGFGLATSNGVLAPSKASPYFREQPLSSPRIPAETKIRGANHVLRIEDESSADGNDAWAALWRVWDWPGWIQPQLDDIARVGNAVRFWGNTLVLALGTVSLSEYLARWTQVMDHAQSVGLLVYPCGGDLAHWGDYSIKESVQCYTELAGLLATYPNVIGMDIVNEADLLPSYQQQNPSGVQLYHGPEPYDQFVKRLGTYVRSHGIPITYSRSLKTATEWLQESVLDSAGDFLDFHIYYTPDPNDSLGIYSTSWGAGKRMIVGEFGMALDKSSDERRSYYTAVRDLTINDPNCIGALAWSGYDPSTTQIWQYGLFDRRRVLREDIGQPFSEFPVRQS